MKNTLQLLRISVIAILICALGHATESYGESVLYTDRVLYVGQSLYSGNGRYQLILQNDRNLVVVDRWTLTQWQTPKPMWSTAGGPLAPTNGEPGYYNQGNYGGLGDYAKIQDDGNFVLYTSANVSAWDSKTGKQAPGDYNLVLQDDGNLVVYLGNTPYWSLITGPIPHSGPPPYMSSGVMLGGPCGLARDSILPMPSPSTTKNFFPSVAFSLQSGFNALLGTSTSVGGLSLLALRAADALTRAGVNPSGNPEDLNAVGGVFDNFFVASASCAAIQSGIQDGFVIPEVAVPLQATVSLQQAAGTLIGLWQNGPATSSPLSSYDEQVQNLLLSQYDSLLASYEKTSNLKDVTWIESQLHRFFADQIQRSIDCRTKAALNETDEGCLSALEANGRQFASFLANAVAGMTPVVQTYAASLSDWQNKLASLHSGVAWLQANIPIYQSQHDWWQSYVTWLKDEAWNAYLQAIAANGNAYYWYDKAVKAGNHGNWTAMFFDLDKFYYYEGQNAYWNGQVNYYNSLLPAAMNSLQTIQGALDQFHKALDQSNMLIPAAHIIIDTLAQGIKSLSYQFQGTTPAEGAAIEAKLAANDPSILDKSTLASQANCLYSMINQYLNAAPGQTISCQ